MHRRRLTASLLAMGLASCTLRGPALPEVPPPPAGSVQPSPSAPAPPAVPERPGTPPPRPFHLSTATGALVAQAHAQAAGGEWAQAAETLERALRIEPGNPLVWLELGRVRLGEGNAPQAEAMGRKALTLASGDPDAQAAAWRLIADSLRARGRNQEAADAEARAGVAAPH